MQTAKYNLPTKTATIGTTVNDSILLKDLPAELHGRIAHLVGLTFHITLTPTHTTAPTIAGQNFCATAVDFTDGTVTRFQGGFNHMRAKERLGAGRNRLPEADTNTASGTARYWDRHLDMGPPHMASGKSDWAYPVAALEQAAINLTYGALANLSADATAATLAIRTVAHLALFDEIRLPPAYVFNNYTSAGSNQQLPGRALYESIAVADSATFGAIAAGDFGNFSLDLGMGDVIRRVQAEDLAGCYMADFSSGELGGFSGEPEAASHDNMKVVDHASPLALIAAPNDLQPVLWSPPGGKISKLFEAPAAATLTWDGTQTTAIVLCGRILYQSDPVLGAIGARAVARLKRSGKAAYPKTLSKRPYTGPYKGYYPHVIKV